MIDTDVADLREVILTLLTFSDHRIDSQLYDTQNVHWLYSVVQLLVWCLLMCITLVD